MKHELTLQQYAKELSENGGGKELMHYKCVPGTIGMFNTATAMKKLDGDDKPLITPKCEVDSVHHKVSFVIDANQVSNPDSFVKCVHDNFKSPAVVKKTSKTITIKV